MRSIVATAFVVFASALACEADLETECVGGDCEPYQPSLPEPGEGGGGGGRLCYEGCVTDAVSGNTGELPCEVEAVLDNCRRCHTTPLQNGAPFPLDTYEDTQQLYLGTAIWARLDAVVSIDFMPLQPPLLTDDEKAALLDDWACRCAPPREAGVTCP